MLSDDQAMDQEAVARQIVMGQASTLSPLDKSLIDLSWPPKQVANLPPEGQNQGVGEAGPGESLPVKKTAFAPEAGGIMPPSLPRAPGRVKSASGDEGGIRRYRDLQGVLVITNVAPATAATPSGLAQQEGQGPPGIVAPEEKMEQAENLAAAPGLQPVSYDPDQPSITPAAAAAVSPRSSAPARRGGIHCYKDKNGVLHIENVGAGREKPPQPPVALALAQNGESTGPPQPQPAARLNAPTGDESTGRPAALQEEKAAQPPPVNLAAADPQQEKISEPSGPRRYRDRLGFWQFQPAGYWSMQAPPLLLPAASSREVLLA
jgi:hypothetical protein